MLHDVPGQYWPTSKSYGSLLLLGMQVFEELWGTHALLSSFDSINAVPAGSPAPRQAWLHVDQAPWRRGLCCIQGLVNLADASPQSTGTLLVKDRSHLAHSRFFEEVSQVNAMMK